MSIVDCHGKMQIFSLVMLLSSMQSVFVMITKSNRKSTHLFLIGKLGLFMINQSKLICLNIVFSFFYDLVNQASAARVKEMSMCKMPRSTNRHDISNAVNGVASNDEPVSAVGHKQIGPQFKAQSNKHKQFRFAGFNMLKSRPMDKNNNQNQNQNSKKGTFPFPNCV